MQKNIRVIREIRVQKNSWSKNLVFKKSRGQKSEIYVQWLFVFKKHYQKQVKNKAVLTMDF